ncbi:MAG: outer membrane protein assembly factor BamD [Rickettsiales bacterium]|jgi:outer membrane protein assembly factor BamD|nr:outer membrane protein assembly factor BamD [Rickettsiales bacterium]
MRTLLILALFALASCAPQDITNTDTRTDQELFDIAMKKMNDEYYDLAVKDFEQIEYIYPYSPLVSKAWIMAGYAAYKDKKYLDAAGSFEKMVKHHPSSPQAPYAMYMVAISYYDAMMPITRDQKSTSQALVAMERLVAVYPESEYAADVKPKIIILRNNLAAKEMSIAEELFRRRNLLAALNRYQTVIVKFDTTLFVPEAIFRAAEIYRMLGEQQDAENMMKLLKANSPESEWVGKI